MLDDYTIEWIRQTVRDCYSRQKLPAALKALNQFFALNGNDTDFESYVIQQARARDLEKPDVIRNFVLLEVFMKSLADVVFIDVPLNAQTTNALKRLATLIQNVYHKIDEDVPLKSTDPETLNEGYAKYYLIVYQFRNALTHDQNVDLSYMSLYPKIQANCICMLDLVFDYRVKLDKLYKKKVRAESFNRRRYATSITSAYNRMVKEGFGYLDCKWNDENNEGEPLSVDSILSDEIGNLKLLGDAGCGKTTALKRIEYLMAKKLRNDEGSIIPVYIELADVRDEKHCIARAVADRLGVDEEIAASFLQEKEVCLLLDGFNEILDPKTRRTIACDIDDIAFSNEALPIILTDRARTKNSNTVLSSARRLSLFDLTLEDKLNYFKMNSRKDKEALKLIMEQIKEKPNSFALINTPLKLHIYLELVRETHQIPADLTSCYLERLIYREADEKKDARMEHLNLYMEALALINHQSFRKVQALQQMSRLNELLGFENKGTDEILKLAIQMGILKLEDDSMVSFLTDEFRGYYETRAIMEGLADLAW